MCAISARQKCGFWVWREVEAPEWFAWPSGWTNELCVIHRRSPRFGVTDQSSLLLCTRWRHVTRWGGGLCCCCRLLSWTTLMDQLGGVPLCSCRGWTNWIATCLWLTAKCREYVCPKSWQRVDDVKGRGLLDRRSKQRIENEGARIYRGSSSNEVSR